MKEHDSRQFQRNIYLDLDQKLRKSGWNSGASEAHGLLTGLACRGVTGTQVINKLYLLRVAEDEDSTMLQGLFEFISRDLESTEPTFDPLFPDQETSIARRSDETANWCSGFIQGFCHDGSAAMNQGSTEVQELLQDVMNIGGMQAGTMQPDDSTDNGEEERALTEIEEYLRVGIQLIYDETVGFTRTAEQSAADELH